MKSIKRHLLLITTLLVLSGLFILVINAMPGYDFFAVDSMADTPIFIILLITYLVLLFLPNATWEGVWSSFSFLAITIGWLLLADVQFFLLLVVGSGIAYLIEKWWNYPNNTLSPLALRIHPMVQLVAGGYAWFIARYLSAQWAISAPKNATQLEQDLMALMLIWFASYIAYQGMKLLLLSASVMDLRHILRSFVRDIALGLYAIIATVALYTIGRLAFAILLFIIGFQTLRITQIRLARQALGQRLNEMSSLIKFARYDGAVGTKLVMQAVFTAVNHELANDGFFIAINDDNYNFTYHFVVIDGKEIDHWDAPETIQQMIQMTLAQRTYLLRQHVTSPSESVSIASMPIASAGQDFESILITPLIVGSHLLGAIGLLHTEVEKYQPWDIVKLQNITSQASLMMRNAVLDQESARMTKQLAQINHVMRSNLTNLSRDEAFKKACEIAREIANSKQAIIYLAEVDYGQDIATEFTPVAQVGLLASQEDERITHILPPDQHHKRYKDGQYIINDVTTTNDESIHALAKQLDFQATAEVPLRSGYRLIGILAVYHDNPHYYDNNTIHMLSMVANQLASLLENNHMLETLESYATEQAQLVHLTRTSTQSLQLNTVIYSTCRSLQDIFQCDIVEIVLMNEQKTQAEFYHMSDHINHIRGGQPSEQPLDDDALHIDVIALHKFPELMALKNQSTYQMTQFTRDDPALSPELKTWLTHHQMHNVMIIPMDVDSEALGFIFIGKKEAYTYPDNTINMLEMATNQVSAQIHNANIYTITNQDLRQRLTELVMIEDIIQQISQALDNVKIINNVLDAALQSTQADMAMIALYQQGAQYDTLILERGQQNTPSSMETRSLGGTLIERVLQTQEVIIANDSQAIPDYVATGMQPYRSILAVPIMSVDTTIGVLNLESQHVNFFTEEQISFIKGIAGHAAVSIDNANLLTERQQRINALNALQKLTLDATRIMNEYQMATLILSRTVGLLQGSAGVIYAYDKPTDELVLIAQGILHDGELDNHDMTINERIFYNAVTHKETQVIHAQQDADPLLANGSAYNSVLLIPIKQEGSISHVMGVGFAEHWQLTEQTRNTVSLLAVQVAVQLEYARLNEALRKQNDQMRTILDANRDGIVLLDQYNRLQEANPAAENILGIPLHEYIHERYTRILTEYRSDDTGKRGENPQNTVLRNVTSSQELPDENGRSNTIISQYELQEGMNTRYIQEVSVPVTDSDGQIVGRLLSLRDITEEQLLIEYRQRLQNMLYHDLRSPLGSIISGMYLADSILEDPQGMPIEEAIKPTIKITLDSATYLLSLLDTLRDIPRLEKGQLPLNIKPISVHDLADHAFKTLATSMTQARLNAEIQLDESLRDVHVDKDIIQRVFINLIHNAFKFTPPNGTILVTATREEADPIGFIRVMVCDTGPGIPDAMRERIFNEFEQIENHSPLQGGKGSGLGLAFCKQAVEAHGGRIWVAGEGPLRGACFAFLLPTH